jgi:hypothetical protein
VRRARIALLAAALAADALGQEPTASVVLRWETVAAAAAYEVQIARDPSFAEPVVSDRVPTPGYRWRSIPAERHFWRVRSVDVEGRLGPWSAVKTIEAALRPPEPVAPKDRAALPWNPDGRTVTLSWKGSEVVREYALEVARDPSFSAVVSALRTPATRVVLPLPGAGWFHWRVRAIDLAGGESAPSASRSFSVPPPPEMAERPPGPEPAPGPPAVTAAAGPVPVPAAPLTSEAVPTPAPRGPGEPELPGEEPSAPPAVREGWGGRFAAGILAGWTTNLQALSAPTLGAEALWRTGPRGLTLCLRASWSGESATVPAGPALPTPLEARAQVFPLSLLALYEWPLPWAILHAGAGLSAQLAHLSVGGDSVLEATAGVTAAAGASRRVGAGEVVAEVSFSTGSVEGSLGSLHTGGLQILGGYRFRR